jgi:3-deoxy-7-phosphoheptulonate synthase
MPVDPTESWKPNSWRSRPAAQQPRYEDEAALETVLGRIRQLPPIVSIGEVDKLRAQLAEAAQGRRFLLQGGDCAERLLECQAKS